MVSVVRAGGRDRTVDVAKGIGILLVVLGHNAAILDTSLQTAIFSFHMPLFLFLSGVYLKPEADGFVRSRADAIIKPYLVVGLGFALLLWLKSLLLAHHDAATLEGIAASKAVGVLYAVGRTLDDVPLWFLPALFTGQAAAVALIGTGIVRRPVLAALLVGLMLVTGVALMAVFFRPFDLRLGPVLLPDVVGLPWSLDLVPVTAGLVLAGYSLRGRVAGFRPRVPLVLLAAAAFVAANRWFPIGLDLNSRYVSAAPAVFVTAAAGTYLTLSAASVLARRDRLADILAALGRASLFLLMFHFLPQQATFRLLAPRVDNAAVAGLAAFAAGLAVPLALLALTRRIGVLRTLLLPPRPPMPGNA